VRGGEEGPSLTHLRAAVAELSAAENDEGCAWCRSHIAGLRVLAEDLVRIAELGQEVGRGEIKEYARRLGDLAEKVGALAALGRIIHAVKGVELGRIGDDGV